MKFVKLLFLTALFVTTFGLNALMARADEGNAYDSSCAPVTLASGAEGCGTTDTSNQPQTTCTAENNTSTGVSEEEQERLRRVDPPIESSWVGNLIVTLPFGIYDAVAHGIAKAVTSAAASEAIIHAGEQAIEHCRK